MARRAVNEAIWLLNADNSVSAPASGSVTFYERGGTALATIYSAASGGTALPNPRPVTNGYATGYIDTGSYDLVASANGLTSGTVEWEALRGDSVVTSSWTGLAANPDQLIVGAITRDANGAATSAGVVWPDGDTGTYTATNVSEEFPGAVDAYTITKLASPTITFTQPAVTRDASGAVTTRPAITVA